MLTMDSEILLISSDEPFPQAFRMGRSSSFVRTRRSLLELGRRK